MQVTPQRDTREYSVFENVNTLLSGVVPATLNVLATGKMGELARDTSTTGRLLAMWSVETARETTWTNAEMLWELQNLSTLSDNLMMVIDRLSGLAGSGILKV